MPVKTYKLGPGTLNVGEAGSPYAMEAQVRSMTVKVSEKVKTVDPIPVLSGEELEGSSTSTFEYALVGVVLQDITTEGLTDWTWEHGGEQVPFTFQPTTAGSARECNGVVSVVPLDFGGDVDAAKRPEAAVNWRIIGTPTLF